MTPTAKQMEFIGVSRPGTSHAAYRIIGPHESSIKFPAKDVFPWHGTRDQDLGHPKLLPGLPGNIRPFGHALIRRSFRSQQNIPMNEADFIVPI